MLGMVGSLSGMVSISFSVMGVLISLVSLNLLGVWVGMELSFLSVVCFASGVNVEESESVMKYFIIQVLGSCICGMGFLMLVNMFEVVLGQVLILIGMLMKLGVFPFHFWVAPVVSKLSWAGCGSILLLQKLIPLWVLSNYLLLSKDVSRIEFLCCVTSLVGSLGGLNVLNYRVLLGFSSIQNLGPMLLLCFCENFSLWIYVLVYFVLSGFFMLGLWQLSIFDFQDLLKDKSLDGLNDFWWISLYLFSSAGLPPFLGCALKVTLLSSCWYLMPIGSGFCILTSCVSLVFYLSMVLAVVVNWGKKLSFKKNEGGSKVSYLSVMSLMVNLVGGFVVFLILSL
uniref:NADH dehydrogenase subunit 2 n=1 Tax=Marcia recens TaxID=2490373 RepID=UPI00223734D1|nr:NADH dehydrogenase subunit 2 [Marcia recens]UYR95110.1 NADH dehydrogenase subunit 2 [Marcia recens]